MKAYELMKLAAEDPDKYSGKKYRVTNACVIHLSDIKLHYEVAVNEMGRLIIPQANDDWAYVNSHTELQEIPQPVSFMEAVKAYKEGKTIRSDGVCAFAHIYDPKVNCGKGLLDERKIGVDPTEILERDWYILD